MNSSLCFSSKGTIFEEANRAYDNKNYKKALDLYDIVILEDPNNLDAVYWAAIAAEAEKKFDKRIKYLTILKQIDPKGIMPRAMLIHSYQELGEIQKGNKEHNEIVKLWQSLKNSDFKDVKGYKRDVFDVNGYQIDTIEYFELQNRFPIRYRFTPHIEKQKLPFIILLNRFDDFDNKGLYHLDVFDGIQRHRHKTFKKEPSYNEVRELVYSLIESGNLKKGAKSSYPFEVKLKPWIDENYIEAFDQSTDRYLLEQVVLPKMFFQNPKVFFDSFNENREQFIKSILYDIHKRVEKNNQAIKSENIFYSKIENIESKIGLIKLPAPKEASDSYYIAIFSSKNDPQINRYFALKKLGRSSRKNFLTEITPDRVISYDFFVEDSSKNSFFKMILKLTGTEKKL
ncbi:MAG: hypothetical protein KAH20_03920 [Methylococcales bacterium]|nr:hypothetical protein [Methylococcales bacterium]